MSRHFDSKVKIKEYKWWRCHVLNYANKLITKQWSGFFSLVKQCRHPSVYQALPALSMQLATLPFTDVDSNKLNGSWTGRVLRRKLLFIHFPFILKYNHKTAFRLSKHTMSKWTDCDCGSEFCQANPSKSWDAFYELVKIVRLGNCTIVCLFMLQIKWD